MIPTQTRVVIIGAGIVGCSVAWHLAELGWREIVVVDKGPIFENDGSTAHAPGGMHLTNSSRMMLDFAVYTRALIAGLPQPDPARPFYRPVGGIEIAYTPARLDELKRRQGWATSYGLEGHLISPTEVKERIPIVDERVILGGYWAPDDTNINGWQATRAIADAAMEKGGVTFWPNTPVTDVEVVDGRLRAVMTDKGRIECDAAVLCTNIWSPVLADRVGLKIPLLAAQHQYTISSPLPELAGETKEVRHPIMRHQDFSLYFRQHYDCYGIGNYRHVPLMVDPWKLGRTAMMPFTPEHYTVATRAAAELIPALKDATLTRAFNGMFAFSVDGFPIIGETPQARGFWVATASWITHAGGVGRACANLMTYDDPGSDIHEADINRFLPHQTTSEYVWTRCAQNYREVYDIIHPWQQIDAPRNIRLAPWHRRLEEQRAEFFTVGGWETPQWYAANASLLEEFGERIPQRTGWASRYWSPIQGAEHLAVRARVGLFSIASLAIIEVTGPGALAYLNRLAANLVDKPVGSVIYTAMLTEKGGIICDVTIARRGAAAFWVFTGGALLPHDLAWMRKRLPSDGSVTITDLSGRYAGMGLWGPRARAVLAAVADENVSNEAFPFYTAQEIDVGPAPVYALRISYAGELGWELYAPVESGLRVWDAVWEAGRAHGMMAAGAGAFDSLRLEKGYRLWGSDIHTDYNPLEAGLGWAVRLDKEGFLGRDALLAAKDQGVARKLCCLTLDDPGALAMGKEPILKDGRKIGYVTSANYGYSIGQFIVYGYLPKEFAAVGTQVDVEYFGVRQSATVRKEPLFDPSSERMKG